MIQATELRIGNKVISTFITGAIATVDGILPDNRGIVVDGVVTHENLHGVPLTPRILEACGFKDGGAHDGGKHSWRHADFPFGIDSDTLYYYDDNDCIHFADAEYLHQLQNLFFALTGSELSINLEQVKV